MTGLGANICEKAGSIRDIADGSTEPINCPNTGAILLPGCCMMPDFDIAEE